VTLSLLITSSRYRTQHHQIDHPSLQILSVLATINHLAQRTLLDHDTHNLIKHICSSHGGKLSVRIVRRRNLHNVSRDQIQVLQPPNNRPQLSRRPPARLRGSRGRGNCESLAPSHYHRPPSEIKNLQAGSSVSISIDKYTGFTVPTLSRIRLMIPAVPMLSISLASTISKPQYPSLS